MTRILNFDCHEALAAHLSDEDFRTMAQVDKEHKDIYSQDRLYSPAANELRQGWKEVLGKPGDSAALKKYQHTQKFHQFVRQQPPPLCNLTASRRQDPLTYARLENLFAFQTAPPDILNAVSGCSSEIPVLDLDSRMGGTGYIDFLRPEDLTTPLMRGQDRTGRPFLAVRVTSQYVLSGETVGEPKVMVNTCFQRYSDDTRNWAVGNNHGAFLRGYQTQWSGHLSELISSKNVSIPTDNGMEQRLKLE